MLPENPEDYLELQTKKKVSRERERVEKGLSVIWDYGRFILY
jgi:hypothetical protein